MYKLLMALRCKLGPKLAELRVDQRVQIKNCLSFGSWLNPTPKEGRSNLLYWNQASFSGHGVLERGVSECGSRRRTKAKEEG